MRKTSVLKMFLGLLLGCFLLSAPSWALDAHDISGEWVGNLGRVNILDNGHRITLSFKHSDGVKRFYTGDFDPYGFTVRTRIQDYNSCQDLFNLSRDLCTEWISKGIELRVVFDEVSVDKLVGTIYYPKQDIRTQRLGRIAVHEIKNHYYPKGEVRLERKFYGLDDEDVTRGPESSAGDILDLNSCRREGALNLPADLEQINEAVVVLITGDYGWGSGVIINEEGYVLTADHMVQDLDEIKVKLRSGITLTAPVIRRNPAKELALIKLPGSGYPCLPVSQDLAPAGHDVFVIGAPTNPKLSYTISKGIISGYRENKKLGASYLQTDAAINGGNSGGPMLDKQSRVIGIVSWGFTTKTGLNFGIPTAYAEKFLKLRFKK